MTTSKKITKSPAGKKPVAHHKSTSIFLNPNTDKKNESLRAARPSLTTGFSPSGSLVELPIFSMEGKKVGMIALPESVFGAPWRSDLVHQVTTAMQANARQNRAHTKDRSEVSGGGKKPWKQKGTGQARHGSTRSPLWRHGGVAFGPRNERNYSEKINRKMRIGALLSVLSKKAKDGEIILVDKLAFAEPKTATAKATIVALANGAGMERLATKKKNAALFALFAYDANTIRSFHNLGNVMTEELRNINPVEVLAHKYIVIENPEAAFVALSARTKTSVNGGSASGGK